MWIVKANILGVENLLLSTVRFYFQIKNFSGSKCYGALWMSHRRSISVLFIFCPLQQFLPCNFPCTGYFKMHWFKPAVVCLHSWLKNGCRRSSSLS